MMAGVEKFKNKGKDEYYYGQKADGKAHGKGIYFSPTSKYLYYGFWKNDLPHGFGREFFSEENSL